MAVNVEELIDENNKIMDAVQKALLRMDRNLKSIQQELTKRAQWLQGPRKGKQPAWYKG